MPLKYCCNALADIFQMKEVCVHCIIWGIKIDPIYRFFKFEPLMWHKRFCVKQKHHNKLNIFCLTYSIWNFVQWNQILKSYNLIVNNFHSLQYWYGNVIIFFMFITGRTGSCWNVHPWLHLKFFFTTSSSASNKISSKWKHFHFSESVFVRLILFTPNYVNHICTQLIFWMYK